MQLENNVLETSASLEESGPYDSVSPGESVTVFSFSNSIRIRILIYKCVG
jgi:hypothetical protein